MNYKKIVKNVMNKTACGDFPMDEQFFKKLLSQEEYLYMFYQSAHWQTKDGYQDHLLFQRLYEGVQEEIDTIGEKAVGIKEESQVDLQSRIDNILKWHLIQQSNTKQFLENAIFLEKQFLMLLGQGDKMPFSPGVKNLLGGIADKHESHVYLLIQNLKSHQ